jgi:hypothetical protein
MKRTFLGVPSARIGGFWSPAMVRQHSNRSIQSLCCSAHAGSAATAAAVAAVAAAVCDLDFVHCWARWDTPCDALRCLPISSRRTSLAGTARVQTSNHLRARRRTTECFPGGLTIKQLRNSLCHTWSAQVVVQLWPVTDQSRQQQGSGQGRVQGRAVPSLL